MKKLSFILSMALMLSSSFFVVSTFSSCSDEEDTLNIDNEESANYDVYQISSTLSYNSTNPSERSGYCASSNVAVSANNSAADVCVGWVNDYGYFVCSPDASLLKQCYDANGKNYSSSKTTKIQSLNEDVADYYGEPKKFDNFTVSSEYIENNSKLGIGLAHVSSGQAIAFQTSDGCKGVAKLTYSKVSKSVTISGYVAVPKNSSAAK